MAESTSRIRVDVVAVEHRVWSGEATMVSATTTEGDIGILPGHAPLLGQLVDDTLVRIATDEGEQAFRIRGGYLSITEDGVSVPVEDAEPAEPAPAR